MPTSRHRSKSKGTPSSISASVGITTYPEHGSDFDILNADAAMYAAKTAGKNAYRVFSQEMTVDALDKLKLKAMLRLAIERKEFHLVYQPQIDLQTNRVVGVEALIRWSHPEQGIIPPGRFIPLAEESGMIGEIGEWVVDAACAQGNSGRMPASSHWSLPSTSRRSNSPTGRS